MGLGSPNGITIPLQVAGRTTTIHGEQSAPQGSYTRVRITFQGITALVQRGSTVGGTTLANDASIVLGGSDSRSEVVVSVSAFSIEPGTDAKRTVLFNLRSAAWLTSAAVEARRVEDNALQAAVTASTRLDRR